MKKPKWAVAEAPETVKELFNAKKKVTKKDAKKLKPLTRYWAKRLSRDNWFVLSFGAFLGFVLGVIMFH